MASPFTIAEIDDALDYLDGSRDLAGIAPARLVSLDSYDDAPAVSHHPRKQASRRPKIVPTTPRDFIAWRTANARRASFIVDPIDTTSFLDD